ncbi:unknown [Odoribacter laneus CAG:561]|nr:unknown [Odoribacter laneus CAG:561]
MYVKIKKKLLILPIHTPLLRKDKAIELKNKMFSWLHFNIFIRINQIKFWLIQHSIPSLSIHIPFSLVK